MKSNLKNRFGQHIKQNKLFDIGDRVLVALSGGVDSMVLLHLMLKWQSRYNFEITVIHLNHQLRGKAAAGDAEFVRQISEEYKLPVILLNEDISRFAAINKFSFEEAGHIRRKQLFEEIAAGKNLNKIATGHHMDDQAETVLMRLISGTGIAGLAGIRALSGIWVRPLLFASRGEILQYAREQEIKFREDSSNRDINYQRNKIRHHLLPLIEKEYNTNAAAHLARLSAIFTEWDVFQQQTLKNALKSGQINVFQKKITVELPAFQGYFSWFRMYLIKYIEKKLGVAELTLNSDKLRAFEIWLKTAQKNSRFEWSPELTSRIDNEKLCFFINTTVNPESDYAIGCDEKLKFADGKEITIRQVNRSDVVFGEKGTEYLSGDSLLFPLTIRRWRPSDRFQPIGFAGRKLVSDFLTDLKIKRNEKKQVRVLISGNNIIAVLGHRISENYKVTNNSELIYRITYK